MEIYCLGGKFSPAQIQFSNVKSTNEGNSPKNFLTFCFKHFAWECNISRPYLVLVPIYWTWTKSIPQKKLFFWSNSYKLEFMITSLKEILELPNFGHVNTSRRWFESRNKFCWWRHGKKFWRHYLYFKILFWRELREANFAEIIKIKSIFI